MEDWARDLASLKKRELEGKRIQQAKDLDDRRLMDLHADPMWVEVREQLKKAVREFNEAMGSDHITFRGAVDHNRIILDMEGNQHHVLFSPQTWALIGGKQGYKLFVAAGNGVVWKDDYGNTYTSEQIARDEVKTAVQKKNY